MVAFVAGATLGAALVFRFGALGILGTALVLFALFLRESFAIRYSTAALYQHLWVLPKCFDILSIYALCWPAPPSLFGSRCPHGCGGEPEGSRRGGGNGRLTLTVPSRAISGVHREVVGGSPLLGGFTSIGLHG
jgi:hypothetical protein